MKPPQRKAAVTLGLGLLGCAAVALVMRNAPLAPSPVADHATGPDGSPGDSGTGGADEEDDAPGLDTRGKGRPPNAEILRQRLERHRREVAELKHRYKDKHPAAIAANARLRKVEADLAEAERRAKAGE